MHGRPLRGGVTELNAKRVGVSTCEPRPFTISPPLIPAIFNVP
jgi:hypothetical protein